MPRHLSQHVGGFILTERPLTETVPIGNGAMDDRTFIEWDKDDIDELGILKIDVLALGMLTCIRKCFDLIEQHHGERWELATVPQEVPEVYDMLCRGDSLGVFQVESRAQMNMLPRLKPRCFYDLVIEVAIVRPGPIQGDMVHPYLKRRGGKEPVTFPCPAPEHGPPDELEQILGRTLGRADLPGAGDEDRARCRQVHSGGSQPAAQGDGDLPLARGTSSALEDKMVGRMVERGYDPDFAQRCFDQIKGFGEYGFPESHAASFAHLVYVSSWLKWNYPAAFACGAAQLAADGLLRAGADRPRCARAWRRGARGRRQSRAIGIARSLRKQGRAAPSACARSTGLQREAAERAACRGATLCARSRSCAVARRACRCMRSSGLPRPMRSARWGSTGARRCGIRGRSSRRPTCRCSLMPKRATKGRKTSRRSFPRCRSAEHVVNDYQTIRLSLKAHPMRFLREHYARAKVRHRRAAETRSATAGALSIAGLVLIRQRPGSAKGVVFITIEDETGIANLVVWPDVFEKQRKIVMGARLMAVHGIVQRDADSDVIHVVARRPGGRYAHASPLERRHHHCRGSHPAMRPEPARRRPAAIRATPKSSPKAATFIKLPSAGNVAQQQHRHRPSPFRSRR